MGGLSDKQFFSLLALAVGGVYMAREGIFRGVQTVVGAVTPTNNNNIFAEGVNAVGDILNDGTDNDDFSLGGWVYEITHSEIDYSK